MRRAGYLLAMLPPLAVLGIILVYGVDIPHWDEWGTPGLLFTAMVDGDLSLSHFASTHNESRPFIPKLIFAALSLVADWHPKLHMLVSWVVASLTILLLPRLQSDAARTPAWLMFVWPLMSVLLTTPAQWESHLMGLQLVVYLPPLCLVLALVLQRSRATDGEVFAGCCLLSLVATYSYANGFILWMIAFPWLRAHRTGRRWIVFYALVSFITVALYLHGNTSADSRAHAAWDAGRLHNAACYFLSWIAMPYVQRFAWYPWSTLAGAVLAGVSVVVLLQTRRDLRNNNVRDQDLHPWLMLAAYAIVSGTLAAQGRSISFGVEQALSSRYASFTPWFSVGLLGLAALCSSPAVRRCALLAAVAGACVTWTGSWDHVRYYRHRMAQNRLTARLVELMPDNPMFSNLLPNAGHVVRIIRKLRPAGLMPFDAPEDKVKAALAHPGRKPAGLFRVWPASTNYFVFEGVAGIPGTDRPADFTVLFVVDADGNSHPYTACVVDRPRPDVVRKFGKPGLLLSGFALGARVPQPNTNRLEAFAIDETTWRAYPLRRVP